MAGADTGKSPAQELLEKLKALRHFWKAVWQDPLKKKKNTYTLQLISPAPGNPFHRNKSSGVRTFIAALCIAEGKNQEMR